MKPERPKPSNSIHVPRWAPEEYRQRPRDYDPDLADRILDMVEQGETLNAICSYDRDLPLPGTFLRWTEEEPALEVRFVAALRRGVQLNFMEIPEEARRGNGMTASMLRFYTERSLPQKYGPRATIVQETKPDAGDPGGIDHTEELRRKIDKMADRAREQLALAATQRPAEAPAPEAPSGTVG